MDTFVAPTFQPFLMSLICVSPLCVCVCVCVCVDQQECVFLYIVKYIPLDVARVSCMEVQYDTVLWY